MPSNSQNPFSVGLIDADLFMADSAIQKAETMTSKAGKHIRGIAGYQFHRKNGLTESENSPIMQATGILINQAILWR